MKTALKPFGVGDLVRAGRGRLRRVCAVLVDGSAALVPLEIDEDFSCSVVSAASVCVVEVAEPEKAAVLGSF